MKSQLKTFTKGQAGNEQIIEDQFARIDEIIGLATKEAAREEKRALAMIDEMTRACKWEDILTMYYPLEEKMADIVATGKDMLLREKLAFALGQLKKFDQAIEQLSICIKKDPERFVLHSSIAYTAYNSLYAAKNREIMLSGKQRRRRIEIAHRHFEQAQKIRPDGVTNYYRQAMLLLQIEGKPGKALPVFRKAISNWQQLESEKRQKRQQEAKNYVKSLYNGAKAAMEMGRYDESLVMIKKCLKADESTNYLERQNKYFALGKVNFQLNRYDAARDALKFAKQCNSGRSTDHVSELLARTYLTMGDAAKALQEIERIPAKRKRPYIVWTEADILLKMGQVSRARAVLYSSKQKDSRSRHKTCVKLAGIAYLTGDFRAAMELGGEADEFFSSKWLNHYPDGLFWKTVGALRSGKLDTARNSLDKLRSHSPGYDKLAQLEEAIDAASGGEGNEIADKKQYASSRLRPIG